MEALLMIQEILDSSLPKDFPFYEYGRVRSRGTPAQIPEFENCNAIAYKVFTLDEDVSFLFVFIFKSGLNDDLYTEMGNVLAAKLATELESRQALDDVLISPPHVVRTESAYRHLIRATPWILREYVHEIEGEMIPVYAKILELHEEIVRA